MTNENDVKDIDPKALALAAHLKVDVSTIEECSYGNGEYFECTDAPGEWWVLTDEEADAAWDEDLDKYIDDAMEIPEAIKPYFDEEKWKRDAKMDGRGHSLGRYDGEENEEKIDGVWYYIYRVN